MVSDPYQVLGLSHGATEDEIKKAYRKKAKECHPDLHPDDPNATRKMNEVNEAYDMLMHPEKYQSRREQEQRRQSAERQGNPYTQSSGNGGYNPFGQQGWQSSGGWFDFDDLFGFGEPRRHEPIHPPEEMPGDSQTVRSAIHAINSGQYSYAVQLLSQVPSTGRNARWHYLNGLAHQGGGSTMTALEEMQRAVQMEPNNVTYHQLLQQYRHSGQVYEQRAQGFDMSAMNPQKLCTGFFLSQLLCMFCRCC